MIKLILASFGIVVTGAVQAIIIPLLAYRLTSLYFLLFAITLECTILLFIIGSLFNLKTLNPNGGKKLWILLIAGGSSAMMSIGKVYASNPIRTPPVMQALLAELAIFPSVLFTKYILKKRVTYDFKLILPSIFFLIVSIVLPAIEMGSSNSVHNGWALLWISIYIVGVIFRGLAGIMQEKYFRDTDNFSVSNQFRVIMYNNLFQLLTLIPCFGLEFVIGYNNNHFTSILDSAKDLLTLKPALLFHGFNIACVIFIGLCIYVNTISANYTMIVSIAINPSVAIFFTIFSSLNPGFDFSWWIVVPSLVASVLSIALWMKGEKQEEKEGYERINS